VVEIGSGEPSRVALDQSLPYIPNDPARGGHVALASKSPLFKTEDMNEPSAKNPRSSYQWTALGVAFGAAFGTVFGLLIGGGPGVTIGASVGAGIGVAVGAALDATKAQHGI
jgi:hypothetical protein